MIASRSQAAAIVLGEGPRRRIDRGRPWLMVAAVVLALVCWSATARAVSTSTVFDTPGSYTFSAPAGVNSITMIVVGAPGGSCPAAGTVGGWGSAVTAERAVSRGEQYRIVVGGPGGDCGSPNGGAGGSNGGGAGGRGAPPGNLGGAGGGGATVLEEAGPTARQLVVAGGGGGAAAGVNPNPPHDLANGGDPGQAGGDLGGQPGTSTAGGLSSGVTVHNDSDHGFNGVKGVGGAGGGGTECNVTSPTGGAGDGGGGGGGGYFGGGGGGWCQTPGGGGSGWTLVASSFVFDATLGPFTSMVPSGVMFVYSPPSVEESTGAVGFGADRVGQLSAARPLTVTNLSSRPLTISGALLEGVDPRDFRVSDGCRRPLGPRASCRLTVRLDPRVQGATSAVLKLLTNATSPPLPVHLSGAGTPGSLGSGRGGRAGRVAIVTCDAAVREARACSDRSVSGLLTLGPSGQWRATLSRGATVYAAGALTAGSDGAITLALRERRALRRGDYTLTLRRDHLGPVERERISLR